MWCEISYKLIFLILTWTTFKIIGTIECEVYGQCLCRLQLFRSLLSMTIELTGRAFVGWEFVLGVVVPRLVAVSGASEGGSRRETASLHRGV